MADGFKQIDELQTVDSLNELNRQLSTLFDLVAGDGNTLRVYSGYGAPTLAANNGSIYLRIDGAVATTVYARVSGAWQSIPSGSSAGDVVGPASAVDDRIASFDGTTGKLIQDSGVLVTNVVVGPSSVTDDRLASFDGTTGKLIQDSGVLSTSVVVGPASAVDDRVVTFDGTSGKLIQDSGVSISSLSSGLTLDSVTTFSGASGTGTISITGGESYRFIAMINVSNITQRIDMAFSDVSGGYSNAHEGYWVNIDSSGTITTGTNGGNVTSVPLCVTDANVAIVGDIIPNNYSTDSSCLVNFTVTGDSAGLNTYNTGVVQRKVSGGGTRTIDGYKFVIGSGGGTMSGEVRTYKYKKTI